MKDLKLYDINKFFKSDGFFVEFLKYKMEKPAGVLGSGAEVAGVSGLLWIHLLAGRGLRSSVTSSSGDRL